MKSIAILIMLVSLPLALSASELNAQSSQIIRGLLDGQCVSGLKEEVDTLKVSQLSVNKYCECSSANLTAKITEEDWQQMVLGKFRMDSEEFKQKALSASDSCSEYLVN
jgi:hypothetical protein